MSWVGRGGWYPVQLRDTVPGMPTGAGSIRADRSRLWERVPSQPVVLLGRLVDSRLGDRARIGVYNFMPENPYHPAAKRSGRPT